MTAPIQHFSQFWNLKGASISRFGVVVVMVYLILTVLTVLAAWSAGGDDKGRFVLLQLPLALQMAFLDGLGLMGWFAGLSWPVAYMIFLPATCHALYTIGKLLSGLWRHNKGVALALVILPCLVAYYWANLMRWLS